MILEILTALLVIGLLLSWRLHDRQINKIRERHALELTEARRDAVKRSRSTIEGQVFEQLVPHFPEWKYTPSEARFLGSPIDYVVFEGMSTGKPDKIVLVEVKKGTSKTTPLQNKIKKLIKEGKVEWETLELE